MTHWTIGILVAVAVLIIAWDIVAAIKDPSATISSVLRNAAKKYLVLAFAFGVLMGHLFWPQIERCVP